MKIGLLEWICGGGLSEVPSDQIAPSLLTEGWSMLSAVAGDLAASGHIVSIAIDSRLVSHQQLSTLPNTVRVIRRSSQQQFSLGRILPSAWQAIARDSDALLTIAPEISGVLSDLIPVLTKSSGLLCNSSGDFLRNSCDKLLTAAKLSATGVRHPQTVLLGNVTPQWLHEHQASSRKWITKPRFGAGCDGIRIVDEETLLTMFAQTDREERSQIIVQPWLSGLNFSRSAIVDSSGNAFWLPLVTQELSVTESIAYRGGNVLAIHAEQYLDTETSMSFPVNDVESISENALRALGAGAFGWVGLDLLYLADERTWLVIEANPRLTTSFVGLNASCSNASGRGGLMHRMIEICQTGLTPAVELTLRELTWQSLRFYP